MIQAECAACGAKLRARPEKAGRTVSCPSCGRSVHIPDSGVRKLMVDEDVQIFLRTESGDAIHPGPGPDEAMPDDRLLRPGLTGRDHAEPKQYLGLRASAIAVRIVGGLSIAVGLLLTIAAVLVEAKGRADPLTVGLSSLVAGVLVVGAGELMSAVADIARNTAR